MLSVARSGCVAATEPSINPTMTSGLPAVSSIKAVRFTALNGDRLAGIRTAATMVDTHDYPTQPYHTGVLYATQGLGNDAIYKTRIASA
jgi:hypothetical protein